MGSRACLVLTHGHVLSHNVFSRSAHVWMDVCFLLDLSAGIWLYHLCLRVSCIKMQWTHLEDPSQLCIANDKSRLWQHDYE
ncbi:hypothetical protein BDR05DRAFT_623454 [Suillus weaverae]|nr:hypothetical protein BDR05DRAFT_623454 [Suillus weaverae]